MAGKKKTRKASRKDGRALRRLRLLWRPCLLCLLVLGAVGAACLGARRGWAALARRPEFALSPARLSLGECPPCVRADPMAEELREQLSVALQNASIFQGDLCHRVQQELRARPWVLHVRSVSRRLPNRLHVEVVFRRPAGLVGLEGRQYVVDRDGCWLPDRLYMHPPAWAGAGLPVIVNGKLSGHPREGQRWNGAALAVGARLTAFLLEAGILNELSIREIDVTQVGAGGLEPDIVLRTESGALIKWGCSDAYGELKGLSRPPSEYPDSEKLRMLRSALAEYPGLEGPQYVDLRFNKIFSLPSPRRDVP